MAGQPKRRAMIEALEARTREYFEDDTEPTTLDYVACWIEDGHTLNELAYELQQTTKHSVHREWVGSYLRKQYGEARATEMLANARARASHSLAEDAIALSDEAAETSVAVARNGLRARSRQWIAERWNPQQYGQAKQTNVSISLTSLHLTALQHASPIVTGSLKRVANNTEATLGETGQPIAIASVKPDQA